MSAGFRRTSWTAEPGVRLRPVPEQRVCLAYTPARPNLHALNLTAWFVLSLCDGRSYGAIAREFRRFAARGFGPGGTTAALREALLQLHALGLVRRAPAPRPGIQEACP